VKGFSGPSVGNVKTGRKGYCPSLRGDGAHSAQSLRHEGTVVHSESVVVGYSIVMGEALDMITGLQMTPCQ
jgi:hypothetical protein